ncbi:MAG: PIN domain protein [Pedosphaera sp.]|nr:PIN domain protein [Pedosphaera sp.]
MHDALPFTELHRLELRNAFSLAVFRKQITAAIAQTAWSNLEADMQSGVLVVSAVLWPDVFRKAEQLAELHTPASGSRSLDTLHVAAALVIQTVDFVTFDIRQDALAKLTGLKVRQ